MIEHTFYFVNQKAATGATESSHPSVPGRPRKSCPHRRNTMLQSGVYRQMKRDLSSPVAATLRIGLMVGLALVLILVLLPAALAAQAVGPR